MDLNEIYSDEKKCIDVSREYIKESGFDKQVILYAFIKKEELKYKIICKGIQADKMWMKDILLTTTPEYLKPYIP